MALPENFPRLRFAAVHRPQPSILEIRWALQPTDWSYEDLAFVIFRSDSPTGPWDEVADIDSGLFVFFDTEVFSPGVNRHYYYIIRIVSKSGDGFRDYKPVKLEHDPDHIALEMVRKKLLYLTVKGGIDTAVLKRKTWGPKCSRCFNPERQIAEDADCPECFGTSFTGGYMNPVLTPALFNPPENVITRAQVKFVPSSLYIELANIPLVQADDVVVDRRMNIRYAVEHVRPHSHKMHIVSQIASLLRIDDTDIVYELPIPDATHAARAESFNLVTPEKPHETLRKSRPESF